MLSDDKIIKLVNEKFEPFHPDPITDGWPDEIPGLNGTKKDYLAWLKSPRQGYTGSCVVSSDGKKTMGVADNPVIWAVATSNSYHPRRYEKEFLNKCLTRHTEWRRINRLPYGKKRSDARMAWYKEVSKDVLARGKVPPYPKWLGGGGFYKLMEPYYRNR